MRHRVGGLLVVVALAGLAGCGQPQAVPEPSASQASPASLPPSGSPAQPATLSPPESPKPIRVTVHRTGGFAGVDHRLEIAPDGAWTYVGDGQRMSGRLDPSQVDTLRALATDRRLPAEAKHQDKRICNDGYTYDVTVDPFSITAVECGRFEERPALTKLVEFLKDATSL